MVKRLIICTFVCVLLLAACGPIDYLNTVTLKATRAVADAKAANAEKLAPYEYWSALTYLQMAREKVGYADFEDAVTYGEKSEEMAIKAKKLAAEKGQEGPDARRETHAPAEVITQPESKIGKPPRLNGRLKVVVPKNTAVFEAIVEVDISINGSVLRVKLLKGPGEPLNGVVVAALKKAIFEPAKLTTGQPVAVTAVMRVRLGESTSEINVIPGKTKEGGK